MRSAAKAPAGTRPCFFSHSWMSCTVSAWFGSVPSSGVMSLGLNTTPLPAKVYANEGISQVLFFESDEDCEVSYADKAGKYQKQQGLTLPRL